MQPQLIPAYIAVIILTLLSSCSVNADTCDLPAAINLWKDLVNYSPPASIVSSLGSRQIGVQKIQDATGGTVNLDHYKVQIDKFPTVNGHQFTGPDLVAYVRKNLNDFVDASFAQFAPYQDVDKTWTSDSPVGAVVSIYAQQFLGPVYVDAFGVLCSEADAMHWRFVTLGVPGLGIGRHPVSGTREFGLENGNTFYTRGSDRTTTLIDSVSPGTVYGLGDQLWTSLQNKVADFVNKQGGKATVLSRVRGEIPWDVVQTSIKG